MATDITGGTSVAAGTVIAGIDADNPPITVDPTTLFLSSTSGSIVDTSTYGQSISVYGQTALVSDTSPHESGNSIYFDGSGDYLRIDSALDQLTSTTSPFTIQAWIKPENMTNNAIPTPFALNRVSDGMNVLVYSGTSSSHSTTYGSVHYYTGPSHGNINQTIVIPDNEWTHVAVVFDGTNLISYINGVVSFSEPFTMLASPADSVLLLGGEADSGNAGSMANWYKGYITDFKVSLYAIESFDVEVYVI